MVTIDAQFFHACHKSSKRIPLYSRFKRSVRAVLDRDEDMRLTGTRHPVLAKYKVGGHFSFKLESTLVHFIFGLKIIVLLILSEFSV